MGVSQYSNYYWGHRRVVHGCRNLRFVSDADEVEGRYTRTGWRRVGGGYLGELMQRNGSVGWLS
jgi:hypothetical protein